MNTHRLTWPAFALAAFFALASLFLTTQANRFPSTYHPDEPSKARQVLQGEYNFHHPMLLLTVAHGLRAITGAPLEQEAVTVTGRWASAIFTAGAIFCLVLVAAQLGGLLAAAGAGALLTTSHELFELAHYFKEDPALLLGIGAFFLALLAYDRAPSWPRALALGATLGLAISGKYLGAVAAPFAVILLWQHRRELALARAAGFACIGLAGVLLLVNLPIFLHPALFADGFTREIDFVVIGHKGITRSVPHGVYWKIFIDALMPVRWLPIAGLLLVLYYVGIVRCREKITRAEWLLAAFPIVFAMLLSFSPKTHHRYFLPDTALLLTLAAIGAARLPQLLPQWSPARHVSAALLAFALVVEAPTFLDYYRGFSHDGRTALADYVRAHIPSGTVIVQDKRVDLDALGLPYQFRGKLFAADEGPLDKLRAEGVEYIAVADGDYGRFFLKNLRPTGEGADDYARRRAFYEQLFAQGEKLYECQPGTLQYLQPHLTLYRLPRQPQP
jgi:hypothetical protein